MPYESQQNLDDQAVLRLLGYLTEELQTTLPAGKATVIQSEDEARQAIAALLVAAGESEDPVHAAAIIPEDAELAACGHKVLDFLMHDPTIRPQAEGLVAHPPDDMQMSVELAVAGAVILATLITWLQTKVSLSVERKDGKMEFTFALSKDTTDPSIIKDAARSIKALLTGNL